MFGLGFWEIVILVLALIVFVKPVDLPKVFYRVGRIYGQLQEFNRTMRQTMRSYEREFDRGPERTASAQTEHAQERSTDKDPRSGDRTGTPREERRDRSE